MAMFFIVLGNVATLAVAIFGARRSGRAHFLLYAFVAGKLDCDV